MGKALYAGQPLCFLSHAPLPSLRLLLGYIPSVLNIKTQMFWSGHLMNS